MRGLHRSCVCMHVRFYLNCPTKEKHHRHLFKFNYKGYLSMMAIPDSNTFEPSLYSNTDGDSSFQIFFCYANNDGGEKEIFLSLQLFDRAKRKHLDHYKFACLLWFSLSQSTYFVIMDEDSQHIHYFHCSDRKIGIQLKGSCWLYFHGSISCTLRHAF